MIINPTAKKHQIAVFLWNRVTIDEIRGRSRKNRIAEARYHYWFRLVIIEEWSLNQAGIASGKRHHTTVLAGVRRFAHEHLGTPIDSSIHEIRKAYKAL